MLDIVIKEHGDKQEKDLLLHILANQLLILKNQELLMKQSEILESAVSGLEKAVKNIPATGNPDALSNDEAQGFADRITAAVSLIPQVPAPVETEPAP